MYFESIVLDFDFLFFYLEGILLYFGRIFFYFENIFILTSNVSNLLQNLQFWNLASLLQWAFVLRTHILYFESVLWKYNCIIVHLEGVVFYFESLLSSKYTCAYWNCSFGIWKTTPDTFLYVERVKFFSLWKYNGLLRRYSFCLENTFFCSCILKVSSMK